MFIEIILVLLLVMICIGFFKIFKAIKSNESNADYLERVIRLKIEGVSTNTTAQFTCLFRDIVEIHKKLDALQKAEEIPNTDKTKGGKNV